MSPIVCVWAGIGGTAVLGYWMLDRAIKFQQKEIEEKRKQGEALAKP